MTRFAILAFLLTIYSSAFNQVILLSDDIEAGSSSWQSAGSLNPNAWIFDVCAGNGSSLPGSTAMYISGGGIVPGCGLTGTEQYSYVNSPSGTQEAITYATIDAGCVTSITVDFEYKIEGNPTEDYAELVYSNDGGLSWIPIGSNLAVSSSWTSTSVALPALLEGTIFNLGFRFTYNDLSISGVPLAIDNIVVYGVDLVPPLITCPLPIPLYVSSSCEENIIDYTPLALVVDNCSNVSVTQTPTVGSVVNVSSSQIVILTATDASGNQSQCQFIQTIFDTISPSITCPGNQSVFVDNLCAGMVGDYTALAVTNDNCISFSSVTVTQTPPPGSIIGADAIITLTAEDGYTNTSSCPLTLFAIDTIPPLVICPSDTILGTNSGCQHVLAGYAGMAIGTDNCAPVLSYTQSPPVGSVLQIGTQLVTITVFDDSGNMGTCDFNLDVQDLESPTISVCGSNQNVIVDSNCQGIILDYTSLTSAIDNCSSAGNLVLTQSPVVGTTISSSTTVTVTVTDEAGNNSNCQFLAILTDTISPILTCPADFSLSINSSCEYVVPDITALVIGSDNCSLLSNMSISQSPSLGATGNGITNVLITLFDEQGNLNTCITTITPIDTVMPTVTCPSPAPINNGINCNYTLPNFGSSALVLDNCPDYTIIQSPSIGTIINPGTNIIDITVIDAGGNSASCQFPLVLTETELPTITCPPNISTCDPNISYSDPSFTDNCLGFVTQTDLTGLSSGNIFPIGITNLEYTVADSSGNIATCSFSIEVLDFPSIANINDDTISICDVTSTILNADSITSGTGLWTVLAGQGSFNNQFTNVTGVNNLIYGENIFVWSVSSVSCGSYSDTVVVISSQSPLSASIPQDTLYGCALDTIDLITSLPLYGSGIWTTNSSSDIINPASNITSAIVSTSGWSEFVWTVSNGSCASTSDTLLVFSNLKPSIITSDMSICYSDESIQIIGSTPLQDQVPSWSFYSGDGLFGTPLNYSTSVYQLSLGGNSIVYSMAAPNCPTVHDTLQIISTICDGFVPDFPTMITPNYDGVNDLFEINFLEIIYPECHVVIFNRWGSVVYESIGYEFPWDGTYKNEALPMGTYFFKIELNDIDGTVYTGDISIIH